MAQRRCGPRCARVTAIGVGAGAIAGVAVSVAEIFQMHAPLRGFVWPLAVAAAALWLAVGTLAVVGALSHPAAWLVIVVAGTVQVLGDYETESYYLPALAAGMAALVFAYSRSGARLRALPRARHVLLGLAALSALLAIGQMQTPTERLNWERVRRNGVIEVRTFVSDPPCTRVAVRDVDQVDQGCDVVIPANRAGFVIGYAAAAMLLGAAGVVGARETERV